MTGTHRHSVLLVADHRAYRHLLDDALGPRAEVVEGDVEEITDGAHDLVVVDDTVLDRSWRELTWRRARERPVLLPALVLSARHGAAVVAKAYEGAVDDITTTPVDPGELRVRLETLLHARVTSLELERTRRLVDQLPAGVFQVASTGVLVDAGAGLAELLGVPNAATLVGSELAAHLARPGDAARLLEQARADGLVRDFDLVLARADGVVLSVRVVARLVVDGNDSSVAAVAFPRVAAAPSGYTVDLVTGSRTPERTRSETV